MTAVGKAENETIFAAGRDKTFDAAGNLRCAEVSFTFEEDDHGQGLVSRILWHLAHLGREKALAQFEPELLPKNKAMLTVLARSGLPLKKASRQHHADYHATFYLAAPNSIWTKFF